LRNAGNQDYSKDTYNSGLHFRPPERNGFDVGPSGDSGEVASIHACGGPIGRDWQQRL
jgi:hypothetical protein